MRDLSAAAHEREDAVQSLPKDLPGAVTPERREKNRRGFMNTMEASVTGKSSSIEGAPPAPRAEGGGVLFQMPLVRAAAAILLLAAGWLGYALVQRSLSPTDVDPGPDIRMGSDPSGSDQSKEGADAPVKVVSRTASTLVLDLGQDVLEDGWYEARVRASKGAAVLAETSEWHVEPRWTAQFPQGTPALAGSVWIELRVMQDDGSSEGFELSRWEGPVGLGD